MPMELLGLSILAIVAIVLFIAGLGVFKVHPFIGLVAGIGVFVILLAVMVGAVFGSVGFIDTLVNNAWVRYITVGGASYVLGTIVALLF